MSIDIQVECPFCRKKGKFDVNLNLLMKSDNGTITIDVSPDDVCPHAFQVIVDKNGDICGYQKMDPQADPLKKRTRAVIKRELPANESAVLRDFAAMLGKEITPVSRTDRAYP